LECVKIFTIGVVGYHTRNVDIGVPTDLFDLPDLRKQ